MSYTPVNDARFVRPPLHLNVAAYRHANNGVSKTMRPTTVSKDDFTRYVRRSGTRLARARLDFRYNFYPSFDASRARTRLIARSATKTSGLSAGIFPFVSRLTTATVSRKYECRRRFRRPYLLFTRFDHVCVYLYVKSAVLASSSSSSLNPDTAVVESRTRRSFLPSSRSCVPSPVLLVA